MAGSNFIVRGGGDFSQLTKDLEGLQSKMTKFSSKIGDIGKTMTAAFTVPIVGAGAAAFKLAADMEDAMGATDQIYGDSSNTMKKWANSLESYYGIASSEALEYANMMGSMLQNIGGLTEEEAAKQSQTLIKLAGDLTAMYGGTTQDAVRALTGALKGNNTMLDNYGMAVNDAMIKTKALEMGLYDGTGQMDLATKQAATLALIMEQTGTAQGQAARESDGASGSMRAMATELKNLAISFGQILLPIITPFIAKLQDMITKFASLDEGQKKTIVTILGVVAAIGPLLLIFQKVVQGVNMAISVFNGLGTVFSFLAANPMVLVIAAVAALAIALINLWDTNENFRNSVTTIWNNIKTTIKGAINGILGYINKFIDGWNKIELNIPTIKIPFYGEVGGWSIGLPNIPKIPMLADGGIVNSPTLAMIGEAGPEAVVPLNKGFGNGIVVNVYGSVGVDDIGEQLVRTLRRKGVMSLA